VARVPLGEGIPLGGVRTGPREVDWHAKDPSTLVWIEALDGGDPKRKVDHRDRILQHDLPWNEPPRELWKLVHRFSDVLWMPEGDAAFVATYDRDRNGVASELFSRSDPAAKPILFDQRNQRDRYGDPGSVLREHTTFGTLVARVDGRWIYRAGSGASRQGDRPFLDRQDLDTLRTERLWRCMPGAYEQVLALVTSGTERLPSFLTSFESPKEPQNIRLRDLEVQGDVRQLTSFESPSPKLARISQRLLTYERADGVSLSARLYLPPDWSESQGRLPLCLWAYPLEFNDTNAAGQVSGSPFRFSAPRGASQLFFLLSGYAVLDGAAMPVIGDPETVNDTFIEQIVSSASAAIDAAVATGAVDRDRVGIGGHSYGAFMTAHLLAHSDLFRAGIARSGAYNRTLTPFGFQAERRTLWEAPEAYVRLSPLLAADKIDEPLLLIHGAADQNSGTFPLQSERLFHAIKGNGGIARHVELPLEGHGYQARESVLHALSEMIDWFDEYVKGKSETAPQVEASFLEEG
jgi:dipeptidyl aminopeptidase/acylaminoacyl peptidase